MKTVSIILSTISKASQQLYAPSRQYLNKLSKRDDRPDFFTLKNDKYYVDTTHPEWIALLKKRAEKDPEKLLNKNIPFSIQNVEHKEPEPQQELLTKHGTAQKDIEELVKESQIANLEEQILKNKKVRLQNEQEEIKLRKSCKDIAEIRLVEFLYLGYMEKMNIELLALNKKIGPIIDNLIKEKDSEGVKKRYQREFESMLRNIKAAQKADLEKWENEK